jgi:hypothetical protein
MVLNLGLWENRAIVLAWVSWLYEWPWMTTEKTQLCLDCECLRSCCLGVGGDGKTLAAQLRKGWKA